MLLKFSSSLYLFLNTKTQRTRRGESGDVRAEKIVTAADQALESRLWIACLWLNEGIETRRASLGERYQSNQCKAKQSNQAVPVQGMVQSNVRMGT